YASHFAPIRRSVTSLLEIGIGGLSSVDGYTTVHGGMSLRMWERYFPNAQVVGLDIEEKVVPGKRIVVEQGSQADRAYLRDLGERRGPFDIVIDDGSHVAEHVRISFEELFRFVRPGGIYVIEDIGVSFDPVYGGGPPGTPRTHSALLAELNEAVLRR